MTLESFRLRRSRLELVSAGARLGEAGLILPGEGNLSILAGEGEGSCVLITPRGADKAQLDPGELIEIPWTGGSRAELPPEASTETRMHLAIYEKCREAAAIVHAHPQRVLALAGRGLLPDPTLLDEGERLLGAVRRVPAASPGSLRLAREVATALMDAPACVLERHGAVTMGASLEEALRRMLLLERLAGLMTEGL